MNSRAVLIIDDEVEVTSFFSYFLKRLNCRVTTANTGQEAKRLLAENRSFFDLAFVDLKLPDANGLDLLPLLKAAAPACQVIIMTGYSTIKTAVAAMQRGARDYLEKPFDNLEHLEKLILSILDGSAEQADALSEEAARYGILYTPESPMAQVLPVAAKLAQKAINVVIEGETGTGKELVARFMHGLSSRSSHPFVGINCGALPENLLESELFGHEKGSFTGAFKERRGYFELAHKGTLFLDEVGEAPLPIQVKLLRVLETGEYMRIGGEETRKSNIRFLAATNRKLELEVERGHFRSDLLYRLEGVKLTLPPLRERPADIPLIAKQYATSKFGGNLEIADSALELLQQYNWPGNVRQLLNMINQSLAIHECSVLQAEHLPQLLRTRVQISGWRSAANLAETNEAAPGNNRLSGETSGPVEADSGSSLSQTLEEIVEEEAARFVDSLVNRLHPIDRFPLEEVLHRIKRLETDVGRRIIERRLAETKGDRELLSHKLNISKRTIRYILHEK